MAGKILIIGALAAILWQLGAGLYFMMVDHGSTGRTVRALTWRIGLSLLLFFMLIFIYRMGWVSGHLLS